MKIRTAITLSTLVLAATVSAGEPQSQPASAPAQPAMDMKAMEELMMKAATPGPEHRWLAGMAGEWALTVKAMMDPTQPPEVSQGTSTIKNVLGGRFVEETVSGTSMGQPFSGIGLSGYDNVQKKYVGVWIDTMGTGIMTSSATLDAARKVMTGTGQYPDPMTGEMASYKMVTRFVSDDEHVMSMYGTGPDGKEVQMMEVTYRRKK